MSAATTATIDDVIERVEALLPEIAERALQTERDRRIPQETIDEIQAAKLNRILHPTRYGGLGLDYDAYFEVVWRLPSACGSTGWVYAVSSVHHWQVGLAPERVQEEYLADGDVWSCSAFDPRGARVEPADGGWRVSGRWQYSSGCLHADWGRLARSSRSSRLPSCCWCRDRTSRSRTRSTCRASARQRATTS